MAADEARRELARFLRSRRAELAPADVGMPTGARRRTPGLRREEVSQLSGVSLTWYTWLEQGRDINVSRQVLTAIGRTLRLDGAETAHLFALAGHPAEPPAPPTDSAPEALQRLLDAIAPNPAYALSATWDVVAWNAAYAALYPDISTVADDERNLLWLVFTKPAVRALAADWETEARRLVAQFRAEAGHRLDEPGYANLVARLADASPEFRRWWSDLDVAHFASRSRRFHHPSAGALELEHHKLTLADHPDVRVVVYTPTAGAAGREALDRLLRPGPRGSTGS